MVAVARASYRVLEESSIGGIFTHGDPHRPGDNSLVGAEDSPVPVFPTVRVCRMGGSGASVNVVLARAGKSLVTPPPHGPKQVPCSTVGCPFESNPSDRSGV